MNLLNYKFTYCIFFIKKKKIYLWIQIGANNLKIKAHCTDNSVSHFFLKKTNILYQVKWKFISGLDTSFLSFLYNISMYIPYLYYMMFV